MMFKLILISLALCLLLFSCTRNDWSKNSPEFEAHWLKMEEYHDQMMRLRCGPSSSNLDECKNLAHQALNEAEKALIYRKHPGVYLEMAGLYSFMGDYQNAREHALKCLELRPGDQNAYETLMNIAIIENNRDEARKWLDKILDQLPDKKDLDNTELGLNRPYYIIDENLKTKPIEQIRGTSFWPFYIIWESDSRRKGLFEKE